MKRGGVYCCPDCKAPLEDLYCRACHSAYPAVEDIPVFLPTAAEFDGALHIAATYDSIYRRGTRVWESLERDNKEFVDYFSSLLDRFDGKRILEIGCGEGFLLAEIKADEKFAIDISTQAIKIARTKTQAQFSVALAERLPYAENYFDLIVSVGVMEHFLDADKALQEIKRVLRRGGHYVNLVHVRLTFWNRLAVKISKFFSPYPRPRRWSRAKMASRHKHKQPAAIKQPIQNKYTTRSGQACLERNGFTVIDAIHTRKYPGLPLKGPFVVIYVGKNDDK